MGSSGTTNRFQNMRLIGTYRLKSSAMDNRPAIEQVKSGFKIVGAILTSFAAMVIFCVGYFDIVNPEKQRVGLGWVVLLTTILTMFFTVRFWANWFCGIASYLAVRSTFLVLYVQKGRLSLRTTIGLIVAFWLMAILAAQFYRRREFSYFDQLSITTAAVCLFWGFARLGTLGDNAMLVPVAIGIPLLFFSASEKPLRHLLHKFPRGRRRAKRVHVAD
jgi:hypothetical protein